MRKRAWIYIIGLVAVIVLNCIYINLVYLIMLAVMILVPAISLMFYLVSLVGLRFFMRTSKEMIFMDDETSIEFCLKHRFQLPLAYASLKANVWY